MDRDAWCGDCRRRDLVASSSSLNSIFRILVDGMCVERSLCGHADVVTLAEIRGVRSLLVSSTAR